MTLDHALACFLFCFFFFFFLIFLFIFFFQRESYSEGHAQFHRQEWAELVKTFEESLRQFYSALEECRTLCDGPIKYKDNLEFPQVKGHYK